MKKLVVLVFISLCFCCASHKRANIASEEDFVIEMKRPSTRGGLLETAIKGLYFGATYLAQQSSNALTSSYTQSLSISDYYNSDLGYVEKTYSEIHLKKFSQPSSISQKQELTSLITNEYNALPKTRGPNGFMALTDIVRADDEDLLNFHAVIELESNEDDPSITRIKFRELRILFSKTKIFKDEDLNARISLSIEGEWRSRDGSPQNAILFEEQYDFKNIKYGLDNLIKQPIISPWYYDIPAEVGSDSSTSFGIVNITVSLEEYEGNKSRYIQKLPSILSDNKDAIISNGSSAIQKIIN